MLLDETFYEAAMKPVMTELTEVWLSTQHFDASILGGVSLTAALNNKHLVKEPPLELQRVPSIKRCVCV